MNTLISSFVENNTSKAMTFMDTMIGYNDLIEHVRRQSVYLYFYNVFFFFTKDVA